MEIIHAFPGERINIGRRGEHLARQVQFDLTQWVNTYGEGRAELLYQRPGELVPYPIAAERQGNLLLWTVTNTDTACAGRGGRAEIRYYVGDVLVILEISYIIVENTLENPDTPPEPPGADWFGQMLEQVKRVNAPSLNAPILNEATGTWMVWDPETEQYEDTGHPATGPMGPRGEVGPAGPKGNTGAAFTYDMFTAEQLEALRGPAGQNGKDGNDGTDGITPHIGTNGNWWIGETDTGVEATAGAAAAEAAANRAETAADDAETAASRASSYMSTANTAASRASSYASDAADSADEANAARTAAIAARTAAEKAQDGAENARDAAEQAAIRQPVLSTNNTWMVWSASQNTYVDTYVSAVGPQGPAGATGPQGPTGATGPAGADGATAAEVIAAMTKETWTFTLEDGSTVTKVVPLV